MERYNSIFLHDCPIETPAWPRWTHGWQGVGLHPGPGASQLHSVSEWDIYIYIYMCVCVYVYDIYTYVICTYIIYTHVYVCIYEFTLR